MVRHRNIVSIVVIATFITACSAGSSEGSSGTPDAQSDVRSTDARPTPVPVDAPPDGHPGVASCDPHPGDECDLVKQTCSGGSSCYYDQDTSHTVCGVLKSGTAKLAEACSAATDCVSGLFCHGSKCVPACCPGVTGSCPNAGECIVGITTEGSSTTSYHACAYRDKCNPFRFDCPAGQNCNGVAPNDYRCYAPSPTIKLSSAPGNACKHTNDCGESQNCIDGQCALMCWLTTPADFKPGASAGGRFPANGTCTVDGTSYGTCTSDAGLGSTIGVCRK